MSVNYRWTVKINSSLVKTYRRYGKTAGRKCLEILMPVIILSMTIFFVPGKVMADSMEVTHDTAVEGAEAVTGMEDTSDAGLDEAEEEVTEAAEDQMSETVYRIKPLQEQLAQMNASTIDKNVNKLADMDKHWSRQVVGKLTGLGIIAGYDGKFWPENPVQADQFIKMSVLAMGYKIEQGMDYWAQPFIDIALSEGLIEKGEISDYKIPLTREQMARIIVRAALKVDEKPDDKYDSYIIGKIADYEAITDSLKQYVLDSYKLGLIQGSAGKFLPKGTLTRAEAAAVIIRILDTTERKPTAPGEDEMISFKDSRGNPTVVYPGSITELFTVAKAVEAAIPKAKGYVDFFIGDDGKYIGAKMYKDKTSYEQSIFNRVAAFNIAYNVKDSTYAYTMTVWNDIAYEELFTDFMREIFMTIFEKDVQKAIRLHDQYMTQRYTRTDGYNDYTTIKINNRNTTFLRYDDSSFAIQIKLKGLK